MRKLVSLKAIGKIRRFEHSDTIRLMAKSPQKGSIVGRGFSIESKIGGKSEILSDPSDGGSGEDEISSEDDVRDRHSLNTSKMMDLKKSGID